MQKSFVDIRDIAAVAALALTENGHAGQSYNLTGKEALDFWQAASTLSKTLGREIKYRNPKPLYFLFEMIRRGTSLGFAIVMLGLYTSTRFGIAELVTDEVQQLKGRQPISFKYYTQDYEKTWV